MTNFTFNHEEFEKKFREAEKRFAKIEKECEERKARLDATRSRIEQHQHIFDDVMRATSRGVKPPETSSELAAQITDCVVRIQSATSNYSRFYSQL